MNVRQWLLKLGFQHTASQLDETLIKVFEELYDLRKLKRKYESR